MADAGESLRVKLRTRTRHEHAATDAAFSPLDLTTPSGLGAFLKAHHAALSALEPHLTDPPCALPPLPRRLALIEDDLRALGCPAPPPVPAADLGAHDPLGLAYVVGGSSLGGRVLDRRRAASEHEDVKRAGRYMSDERIALYWAELQPLLSEVSHGRREEERCLAAARRAFSLFRDALCCEPASPGGGERRG